MAKGLFRRASAAIVLIVMLMLPFGTCQAPRHAAGHDCCVRHSAPVASLKANCCTVRSELPAIVVEQAVPNPDSLSTVVWFQPAADPAVNLELAASPSVARYSPPPGKSILRI